MIDYVRYRSLYDLDALQQVSVTWPEFVAEFSNHLKLGRKDQAPGFGPYAMASTPYPCVKHKGRNREYIHRCDDCVIGMTMAVFDVDVGTLDDIKVCQDALVAARLTHLFYSSYSYRHDDPIPKFRLVIPLSEPMDPDNWQPFREAVIKRFSIPADVKACSGVSHFYYMPSCPVDGDPIVDFVDGIPLDPATIAFHPVDVSDSMVYGYLGDWEPAADPVGPVDLEPLKKDIRRRAAGLKRRKDLRDNIKGEWLSLLVAGEALAEHGERNTVTSRVAGMLAWMFSDQPVSVIRALMLPSLRRMQDAGSSLTVAELDRFIISSLRKKAEADARNDIIEAAIKEAVPKY